MKFGVQTIISAILAETATDSFACLQPTLRPPSILLAELTVS
jgi:hypothetical protein